MIKLLNPTALWFLFLLIPIFLMYFSKAKPRQIIVSTNIFWLEAVEQSGVKFISVRWRLYYFLSFILSLLIVLFLIAAASDPVYLPNEIQPQTVTHSSRFKIPKTERANVASKNGYSTAKPANNTGVGITRFQPRLSFYDLSCYELFVELTNFGDDVIETRFRVFVDERLLDVISVKLNPHEVKRYTQTISNFPKPNTQSQQHEVVVRGELDVQYPFTADIPKPVWAAGFAHEQPLRDATLAYSASGISKQLEHNIAYTILSPPILRKILYYGEYNFFLVNALNSYIFSSRQPIEVERITKIPEIVPSDSVLVINRNVPPILPAGNVIIFDPKNDCNLFGVGELLYSSCFEIPEAEHASVASRSGCSMAKSTAHTGFGISSPSLIGVEANDSLLTRFLQFQGKELSGVRKLYLREFNDNNSPKILLATVENQPVYIAWNFRNENQSINIKSNSNHYLVFAADISRGDFVLQTTFPILISNALNYFSRADNELEQNYNVGEQAILKMDSNNNLTAHADNDINIVSDRNDEQLFFDFSNLQFWFLFSICALILMLADWIYAHYKFGNSRA
ncbi:MAG: BatA domain-containing protein [Planctomycetaceae bacterium]|nr:BatA domain-containing protein [Planctomycetaceae bacterium]